MADCRITCITLSDSSRFHERIIQVGNGSVPWFLSTSDTVRRIETGTDTFYVMDTNGRRANVGVVKPTNGTPYLRTYADGIWTDNLLSLVSC
ncbi:DUF3892 domain-containing protein [Pseudomonas sp. B28(2017)]|uniref:DUF3892 domain-containing protein n=1 Tax=Pseudomonas sp. B28(2017) TaxID=1981730 RepID=UPI000A1FA345